MGRTQQRRTASPRHTGAAGAATFPFAARTQADPPSEIESAIFKAAAHLLESMRLDDLTVAHILERAGISRTTFYRYFTSKHQVVSAMLDTLQAELVEVMRAWFAREEAPAAESLKAAITAVADVYARHRPVVRASSEHWHSDPEIGERWIAMMDSFTANIARRIDRERERGAAPAGLDSKRLALALTWGSERAFYLAGYGVFGPRLERDAVDVIVTSWLGTIYQR
jgi:AcrR family transcriptional regulator